MSGFFSYRIQAAAIVAVALFIWIIARLIIRGRLRTEYSFVWIATGLIFLVFTLWRGALDMLAGFFEVYYAPSLLFICLLFMVFVFLLHLSVVASRHQEKIKTLTQENALLKDELKKLKGSGAG